MKKQQLLLAVTISGLLTACGGGGGSGDSPKSSSSAPSSSSAVSGEAQSSVASSTSSATQSSSSSSLSMACEAVNTVQGFASEGDGTTGGADVGSGNNEVVVTTGAALAAALVNSSYSAKPLTIYVEGLITWENANEKGIDIQRDNVSVIGRKGGEFEGVGISISHGASNIIIRNLIMHEVPQSHGAGDIISLDGRDGAVRNIWIDHNELHNDLDAEVPADYVGDAEEYKKDYYDELVSGRADVSQVTISYNYLHDSWKTSLWGSSDSEEEDVGRQITFHHNYWRDVNSRLPLFRYGEAHIYNNYYHHVTGSGINVRMGAVMRIDGNVFENVKNPIVSIDSDELGFWTVADNQFINITTSSGSCSAATPPCYGAHETSTIEGHMPSYNYTLTPTDEVIADVTANAGANKIDACLGFDETASSASSESSSSAPATSGPSGWSAYNGDKLPSESGSVSLANGGVTEFSQSSEGFFTQNAGTVTFDTTAVVGDKSYASLDDIVPGDAVYPKQFTLLAGITGNSVDARVVEIDMSLGENAGTASSRVKAILRADGTNQGIQLEKVDGTTSQAAYDSSAIYSDFRVYQIAITLTSATTGTVNVYAQGADEAVISYTGSLLQGSAAANYLRFGDGGGSVYKASIDWIVWTSEGAFTPSEVKGSLPTTLGELGSYAAD